MQFIEAVLTGGHCHGEAQQVPADTQIIRTVYNEPIKDGAADATHQRSIKYFRTKGVDAQGRVIFEDRSGEVGSSGHVDPNLVRDDVQLDERPEIAKQQRAVLERRAALRAREEAEAKRRGATAGDDHNEAVAIARERRGK
jgi:hypothetical protein